MGLLVISFLALTLYSYIVFFLQIRVYEADFYLVFHTIRFLLIICISFLAFLLYLMYTYRVEPGNINLFNLEDVVLLVFLLSLTFFIISDFLIRSRVFPKFQEKYGLKSRHELAKLTFYNKKKMTKMWENENVDLEYYKP